MSDNSRSVPMPESMVREGFKVIHEELVAFGRLEVAVAAVRAVLEQTRVRNGEGRTANDAEVLASMRAAKLLGVALGPVHQWAGMILTQGVQIAANDADPLSGAVAEALGLRILKAPVGTIDFPAGLLGALGLEAVDKKSPPPSGNGFHGPKKGVS